MPEAETPKEQSNRPKGDAFRQQKLTAWQPIMTPFKVVALFFAIGVSFIPTGTHLLSVSNSVYENTIIYDGSEANVDCSITSANQGRKCNLMFNITEDVDGPLYVYYQLENFYQNHRRYVSSVNPYQLNGESQTEANLETLCVEFVKNGSALYNPCGLIANSFFTDIFTLKSTSSYPTSVELDESGIAWKSDDDKFAQPKGFKYTTVNSANANCSSADLPDGCKKYQDSTGQNYLFYYPDDSTTQYLYESYPDQISPLLGVTDEHFKVWMRPAALPKFRKLYGKISGNFKKGNRLVFSVDANFEVGSFDGTKSLVIGNVGEFGGRNPFLGVAYIVVGSISLLFGGLFAIKQLISPRPIADAALLNWT